uniref:AN1-type domain-containing protein n=1 Tax=Anser cygnoides TaxID=8845 RepID=A0A8B9DLB5_ANSCY
MMKVICEQCHRNYCLKHRHPLDHDCSGAGHSLSKAGHAALARAQASSSKAVTPPSSGAARPADSPSARAAASQTPSTSPPAAVLQNGLVSGLAWAFLGGVWGGFCSLRWRQGQSAAADGGGFVSERGGSAAAGSGAVPGGVSTGLGAAAQVRPGTRCRTLSHGAGAGGVTMALRGWGGGTGTSPEPSLSCALCHGCWGGDGEGRHGVGCARDRLSAMSTASPGARRLVRPPRGGPEAHAAPLPPQHAGGGGPGAGPGAVGKRSRVPAAAAAGERGRSWDPTHTHHPPRTPSRFCSWGLEPCPCPLQAGGRRPSCLPHPALLPLPGARLEAVQLQHVVGTRPCARGGGGVLLGHARGTDSRGPPWGCRQGILDVLAPSHLPGDMARHHLISPGAVGQPPNAHRHLSPACRGCDKPLVLPRRCRLGGGEPERTLAEASSGARRVLSPQLVSCHRWGCGERAGLAWGGLPPLSSHAAGHPLLGSSSMRLGLEHGTLNPCGQELIPGLGSCPASPLGEVGAAPCCFLAGSLRFPCWTCSLPCGCAWLCGAGHPAAAPSPGLELG